MLKHAKRGKLRVVRRARTGLVTYKVLIEAARKLEAALIGFDIVGDPVTYYAIKGVYTELRNLAMDTAMPASVTPALRLANTIDTIMRDTSKSDLRALMSINTVITEVINA